MRKVLLAVVAAAAFLAAGSLANRADALTVGNTGIRAAIEDVSPAQQIHCRPGCLHHRWRYGRPTWDGCGVVGPALVVPPVIIGPRRGWCHGRFSGSFRC